MTCCACDHDVETDPDSFSGDEEEDEIFISNETAKAGYDRYRERIAQKTRFTPDLGRLMFMPPNFEAMRKGPKAMVTEEKEFMGELWSGIQGVIIGANLSYTGVHRAMSKSNVSIAMRAFYGEVEPIISRPDAEGLFQNFTVEIQKHQLFARLPALYYNFCVAVSLNLFLIMMVDDDPLFVDDIAGIAMRVLALFMVKPKRLIKDLGEEKTKDLNDGTIMRRIIFESFIGLYPLAIVKHLTKYIKTS